jgi:hypothetical protein
MRISDKKMGRQHPWKKINKTSASRGGWKMQYHKAYLAKWAVEVHPALEWEVLWAVREQCIAALKNR